MELGEKELGAAIETTWKLENGPTDVLSGILKFDRWIEAVGGCWAR